MQGSHDRSGQAWLMVGPAIVVLGLAAVYPMVHAFVISLFSWRWGERPAFVGLDNFAALLGTRGVWLTFGRTLTFSLSAVAIELVIGLVVALAVDQLTRGQAIVRTILILPLMVSGIATSLVWKIMLDPTLGIVNYGLSLVGIEQGPAWFGSTRTAMASLVLVDTWWQTGFVFIILSAALKGLPPEPYEAARIDGAGSFTIFRCITLPLLKPTLVTILVFRLIDTMKVFDIVFGTTGGGPLQATEVVQTFAYRTAFKFLELGRAAAIMAIFAVLILTVSALYVAFGERGEER